MKRSPTLALVPLASLLLLAFGPAERTAPTRWAVLVGVSDYLHFDDVEGGDLPGAEHDARAMRDVLVGRWGFPEENVRLLLNHDATRAGIEEAITGWLAGNARPGDNAVVFFAGHGSQVWDEDGDEDDGLDETLAPADVSPTSAELDIVDDTFAAWLATLPTGNVVVVLDNCNSGTGTRDVTPFSRARRLGRDVRDLPGARAARRALPGQGDESGFDVGGGRALELAAAQPDQAAVDAFFPGEGETEPFHGGAFTTHLVRQLWRAPAGVSYERVFRDVREALKRNRFQQDPHLSEDVTLKALPLFFVEGGAGGAADATLPVTSSGEGRAELGGGLVLGITPGSVFRAAGGATLAVETVGRSSSVARVVSGSVRAGERAALVGYRHAASPLLVNVAGIDSESAYALAEALGADGEGASVRLVEEEGSFSHLLVRRRGTELRVVGADGFVRHDGIEAGPGGADHLASLLRKETAARRLGDMENPAQPFDVELRLAGDRLSLGIGEDVAFHVRSERAGYLTLVDLGTDGTVAVLLPNEDTGLVRVAAGEEVVFPEPGSDLAFQALPPAGRGLVRAFVTDEPLRLEVPAGKLFLQGGEELAEAVLAAVREAAGTVEGAIRLDSWATAALVYDVHD